MVVLAPRPKGRGGVSYPHPRSPDPLTDQPHIHTYTKPKPQTQQTKKQGLRIALTGRDEAGLEPLMAFLARYVTHPDFADTLSDAAHMVLGA